MAKKHGIETATLREMIEATVAAAEKKAREARVEDQQRERRDEKQQASAQREQERQQREQRRAQEKADKEAEKRQREREKELARIAKLPSAEHEPRLAALAKCSGEDLDFLRDEFATFAAVEEASSETGEVKPWPEPVDTKVLLTEVMAQIRRYIVIHDDDAAVAIVLWIFFAWLHDIAVHSTLLVLKSAEPDTGKTTLCGVLQRLTRRAYAAAELTGPGLYRFVDHVHPTLFIDDADNLLERKPDLVHIINVGWTRGTKILRNGHWFDPFCPKVIAGVNPALPRATQTRTITVRLLPKLPGEKVDEFEHVDDDEFRTLRRKFTRWVADNVAALKGARPVMSALNNRAKMNWKLLLAVADLAGDNWPERARKAAVKLTRERRDPSEGKRALAKFYELFAGHGAMLTSDSVQRWLVADDDGEWTEFRGRGPISKRQIALLLDPYDIHPVYVHPDGRKTERGYRVEQFTQAFAHYLGKSLPLKCATVRKKQRGRKRGKRKLRTLARLKG